MADFDSDAQHPATPIRLQQANREGNAPKSLELAAAIQLTVGLVIVYFLIDNVAHELYAFTRKSWQPNGLSTEKVAEALSWNTTDLLNPLGLVTLSILSLIFGSAIVSHLVQTGTASGFKKSFWRPENLSPLKNLTQLFSMDNLLRGVFGIPKVAIVVLISLIVIWQQRIELAGLHHSSSHEIAEGILDQAFLVLISASSTLLVLSLFDYAVQWFSFQAKVRMTDQQLRDEMRLQSPDPQYKESRKELFSQMASTRDGSKIQRPIQAVRENQ